MIRASSLSLKRGDREILRDFDLEIQGHKTLAIIGPNGSGKSSLISALVGDLVAANGTVTIDEKPLADYSRSDLAKVRSVASQHQRFSLAYRVEEILNMSITYSGDTESISRSIDALDIHGLLPRKVTSLSGGEQQRVSIAMALSQRAKYLFFDEPFSAQDVESTERITSHLQELAAEGRAIVIVAHMPQSELSWCDQIIKIKKI
ncbi:MAG: ABC transporter ATP-binding protein [Actinobacteria bacterium]|nr:ABC transporter ATP-binding protein [Actinomycetota bacterium]